MKNIVFIGLFLSCYLIHATVSQNDKECPASEFKNCTACLTGNGTFYQCPEEKFYCCPVNVSLPPDKGNCSNVTTSGACEADTTTTATEDTTTSADTSTSVVETTTDSSVSSESAKTPDDSTTEPNPTTKKSSSTGGTQETTTNPASSDPGRKFDGLSFFGGIVLALGLVMIAFVGYKFYRARSESHYHSLP